MSDNSIQFPCGALPESAGEARLLGIYPQRIEGLYMQRVKTPGGRLTTDQWRGLAKLGAAFASEVPLHVTTRQAIEFHGLTPDRIPPLQRGVAELGLTPVGACGDTLRAITLSPECGLREGSWDLAPLSQAMAAYAESLPFIRAMPRKFKVALAGSEGETNRPWINDLGLIARPDGTFNVLAAGSLGSKPGTGLPLYETLFQEEIVPLFGGLLRLFNEEGDREHRTRARLRHVRQRMGDDAFRETVQRYFDDERRLFDVDDALRARYAFDIARAETTLPLQQRFRFPRGDIPPCNALAIADAADAAGATLRLGVEHDLRAYGPLPLDLSGSPHLSESGPSVVACPGSTWCSRAVVDTHSPASMIGELLKREFKTMDSTEFRRLDDLNIAIAGCPNNCSHPAIADIGLVGRKTKVDGQTVERFRLFAGGGRGRTPALARELHTALEPGVAAQAVIAILYLYLDANDSDLESFQSFVARRAEQLAEEIPD